MAKRTFSFATIIANILLWILDLGESAAAADVVAVVVVVKRQNSIIIFVQK